ncbi:MAG: helix-turn-helix domain-containing protein [Halodesulfurarchaeum sp.]
MAAQDRDDDGKYDKKMEDQELFKAFDYATTADEPYLTANEVTTVLREEFDIDMTVEGVRSRLETLSDVGLVQRREFGPGVAYRATVAPSLSQSAAKTGDERLDTDRDEFIEL